MITFLLLVNLIATILIYPGWHYAERREKQSLWLFAVPWLGGLIWFACYTLGFGSESIANSTIETFIIFCAGLGLVYVKFLVLDSKASIRESGALIAVTGVVFLTLALRAFMPELGS